MLYALGILADLVKAPVYLNIGPGVHLNPEFIQEDNVLVIIFDSLIFLFLFTVLTFQ